MAGPPESHDSFTQEPAPSQVIRMPTPPRHALPGRAEPQPAPKPPAAAPQYPLTRQQPAALNHATAASRSQSPLSRPSHTVSPAPQPSAKIQVYMPAPAPKQPGQQESLAGTVAHLLDPPLLTAARPAETQMQPAPPLPPAQVNLLAPLLHSACESLTLQDQESLHIHTYHWASTGSLPCRMRICISRACAGQMQAFKCAKFSIWQVSGKSQAGRGRKKAGKQGHKPVGDLAGGDAMMREWEEDVTGKSFMAELVHGKKQLEMVSTDLPPPTWQHL